MLDAPLTFDMNADSLPLELISKFTDAVSDVHGLAAGRIAMRGTFSQPALAGGIVLNHGSMKLTSTGMKVSNIVGSVRMLHDTVYVDSIVGEAAATCV
jgi:autotransporter translocation and assembly factor TamB